MPDLTVCSAPSESGQRSDGGIGPAIGWGLFLGMSWTWCIGMYLPVLLVRDYGLAGWIVFTLPNVIGAAAMGWVLRKSGSASKLVAGHRPAMIGFSAVTILFHCFFVGWVVRALVGNSAPLITAALFFTFYFFGRRGRRDLLAAGLLFVASVALFIIAWSMPATQSAAVGIEPISGLVYLAPVCALGFFLCPYLDLTFIRARAETKSRTAVAAFVMGFGVFFLLMLVFTLWYAPLLQPQSLAHVPKFLALIVGGHMMTQASFSVALHTREILGRRGHGKVLPAVVLAVAALLAFLLGSLGQAILPPLYSTEVIYRLFMAAYGLVFPAYVWICVIPLWTGDSAPSIRKLVVTAVAILIAAPMFWMGFIQNQMVWLAPGVVAVLLAPAMIWKKSGKHGN